MSTVLESLKTARANGRPAIVAHYRRLIESIASGVEPDMPAIVAAAAQLNRPDWAIELDVNNARNLHEQEALAKDRKLAATADAAQTAALEHQAETGRLCGAEESAIKSYGSGLSGQLVDMHRARAASIKLRRKSETERLQAAASAARAAAAAPAQAAELKATLAKRLTEIV